LSNALNSRQESLGPGKKVGPVSIVLTRSNK